MKPSRLRLYTALLVVSLIAFSGGCMPISSHNGSDLSKAENFKIVKNVTTEKDLVDHFGAPGNTTTRGDGTRTLTWTDTSGKMNFNLAKGIPIVGLAFMGQHDELKSTSKSITATLANGVVIDYTQTDGANAMAY